jgi:hypothetical protein
MNYETEAKTTGSLSIDGRNRAKGILLVFLFLSITCGCSRPIQPQSDFITIKLGDLAFVRYFDPMEKGILGEDETIRLADFVDSVITVYPQIYAYRIIGSDGFYAAKKGSPDNIWEHMQKGYLKLQTRGIAFDPSLGLSKRYHIKDVVTIELLRKIDTKLIQEEDFSFSLIIDMDVATYLDSLDTFFNGGAGIKLPNFIEPFTSTPQDYVYNLVSAQGGEKTFSWSEIQTGWWLLDLDLTKFSPDLGMNSKIPYLQAIELIPILK